MAHATIRENMIAALARRAGFLAAEGMIHIGDTLSDDDSFADFCVQVVNAWEGMTDEDQDNIGFDGFIEQALQQGYGDPNLFQDMSNFTPEMGGM